MFRKTLTAIVSDVRAAVVSLIVLAALSSPAWLTGDVPAWTLVLAIVPVLLAGSLYERERDRRAVTEAERDEARRATERAQDPDRVEDPEAVRIIRHADALTASIEYRWEPYKGRKSWFPAESEESNRYRHIREQAIAYLHRESIAFDLASRQRDGPPSVSMLLNGLDQLREDVRDAAIEKAGRP